ncbi:MAG: CotH kinase family protein [Gallionella sp.]|nr:CotH kinase family protein [Gallionella sp.]
MRTDNRRSAPVSKKPLFVVLGFVACCIFFFAAGFQYKVEIKNAIDAKVKAYNGITGLYAENDHVKHMGKADKTAPNLPDLKRIYIKIKHNDFESLRIHKEVSLKQGEIAHFENAFVAAEISADNRVFYKAKLRLRGKMSDHVATDKDSYRIQLKNGGTLFNMNKLSLHHPWMRNYMHEKFIHDTMKREGLLFLRYDFVHVTVNDVPKGIYALEENFDKLLVANNELPEGPILDYGRASKLEASIFEPDVSERGYIEKSKKLVSEYEKAATLLHRFMIGEVKASEVFNIRQIALYCAITDLTAAYHGAHYSSIRLYYNPITSKIQFFPYDGTSNFVFDYLIGAGRSYYKTPSLSDRQSPIFKQLFDDTEFYRLYIQALEKVAAPGYVDALVVELKPELLRSEKILQSEWPEFGFFDKWYFTKGGTSSVAFLHSNAERLRQTMDVSSSVEAHMTGISPQNITLSIANTSKVPIEVLSVMHNKATLFEPVRPLIINPMADTNIPAYQKANFSSKKNLNGALPANLTDNLFITYKALGGSTVHSRRIYQASYDPNDLPRLVTDAQTLPWMRVNKKAKMAFIAAGKHILGKPLSLAEGYSLSIGPSTTIQLVNDAFILVRQGRLLATGTEMSPVVIESPNSTGGGIVILTADGLSSLNHVIFNNLKNPAAKGWGISGCVTFYESPVSLENVQFMNCAAEDTLHIVRTNFTMNKVTFRGAHSDAFDGDFVQGSIGNSTFFGSGNDAIDVSGSKITVADVYIDKAGDKGLSAGEHSFVDVSRVKIANSNIGIASKDQSAVTIDDLEISGASMGLSVYQKKSEFGSGKIVAKNVVINNTKQPFLVEYGSTITLDDKLITFNAEMVKGMLYEKKGK